MACGLALVLTGACSGSTSSPPPTASVTGTSDRPSLAATGGAVTAHHNSRQDVPLHIVDVDASPTCGGVRPIRHVNEVDRLLSAFRAARLRGHGAGACMTPSAARGYCTVDCARALKASPGPICLYGCVGYRLVDLVYSGMTRRGSRYDVLVEAVLRRPGSQDQPDNEDLTVAKRGGEPRIVHATTMT